RSPARLRQVRGVSLRLGSRALAVSCAAVWSAAALGIQPMSLYHDLVAGDGISGFPDRGVYRARFHPPPRVALLPGGAIRAAADQNNNRIRAIPLDAGNRVDTLAGTGAAGGADGALLQATFHQPGAIVPISDHAVLVNDEGSARFRVVDIQSQRVETVA